MLKQYNGIKLVQHVPQFPVVCPDFLDQVCTSGPLTDAWSVCAHDKLIALIYHFSCAITGTPIYYIPVFNFLSKINSPTSHNTAEWHHTNTIWSFCSPQKYALKIAIQIQEYSSNGWIKLGSRLILGSQSYCRITGWHLEWPIKFQNGLQRNKNPLQRHNFSSVVRSAFMNHIKAVNVTKAETFYWQLFRVIFWVSISSIIVNWTSLGFGLLIR